MRRLVIISIFLLLLMGCAGRNIQTIEKPVFIKCRVPDIPRAELENIPENATYPEKLKVILNNCLKIERENKMLREAVELCK